MSPILSESFTDSSEKQDAKALNSTSIQLSGTVTSRRLKQKANAESLGLRKIGQSVEHANDAVLAGKLKVIGHLVKVETV